VRVVCELPYSCFTQTTVPLQLPEPKHTARSSYFFSAGAV
jgi:hypothetical protein